MSANTLPFTKMHGIGNDYVYVNGFEKKFENLPQLARRISDRHFGVGSDGLVLILPSKIADIRMQMFNADGSEAEMCGNASRCVAKYAHDHGLVKKDTLTLETGAGIKTVQLHIKDGQVTGATVNMGKPILEPALIPINAPNSTRVIDYPLEVAGTTYHITGVSMGNPHAVLFMKNISELNLPLLGPEFEHHPLFPRRINTEFVEVIDRHHIKMRVWERGAGETLACGTGACAALVACALNNLTDRDADVELRGGTLHIKWSDDGEIFMTGAAVTAFEGNYYLNS